jgi:rare lipoprotein A
MRLRVEFRLSHLPSLVPLTALLLGQLLAAGCSNNRKPATAVPAFGVPFEQGIASWYGPKFDGRFTASGERYDMHEMTAAHRSLPFGTLVDVRDTSTGRDVVVRINDRGPFARNRVIDLSYAAARELGMVGPGTASVELYLVPGDAAPPRYTVQVGAFSEAERAEALQREIAQLYPEAVVDSDGTWHRVQIGAFQDREQAEALRRELAMMGISAIVVSAR